MAKATEWILITIAIALLVMHAVSFGFCLQDDAFISLRFSRNLAENHGIVFNPGERIEGYTSVAWVLLGTIPFLIGTNPMEFVRIAGILAAVVASVAVALLAWRLSRGRRGAAVAASILVAGSPFMAAEAAMGMETTLFVAVVLLAVVCFLREYENERLSGVHSGLLFAVATLVRPEGAMVAIASIIYGIVLTRRHGQKPWRSTRNRILAFLVPVATHLVFRVIYYRDIVPNTFHAKVGGGFSSVMRGLRYAGDFAEATFPVLLLLAVLLMLSVIKRIRLEKEYVFLLVLTSMFTVYVVCVGGDFKPTFRFLAVPYTFIAALSGALIPRLADSFMASVGRSGKRESLLLVVATIVSGVAAFVLVGNDEDLRLFTEWRAEVLPMQLEVGRYLERAFPEGAVLAICDVGTIPYESNLTTIDMHGLCDRHIARREIETMGSGLAGHEKGDGRYILDRTPDVIVFRHAQLYYRPLSLDEIAVMPMSISEREIWSDSRFVEQYRLRCIPLNDYYFMCFAKINTI